MNRSKQHRPAFTLLELVVVLAILAVVTTLAVRSLDGLEDQSRYEKNVRGFEELSAAVLGSPDDRAADGTRTVGGFVADMGRLPKAVADENGNLTLAELWEKPLGVDKFDVRQAIEVNGVPKALEDPQVLVAGGWRGPYLRLPIGPPTWRDGWGNPMSSPATTSPADPNATGYARLRDIDDNPIVTAGQEVAIVRHLGANGRRDSTDKNYDRDEVRDFTGGVFISTLTVQVEVLDGDSPAQEDSSDRVEVRVFGPRSPTPENLSMIRVISQIKNFETIPSQPPLPEIPVNPQNFSYTGLNSGSWVVRAYFTDSGTVTTSYRRSAVKNLTLRPGANFVELTIDR